MRSRALLTAFVALGLVSLFADVTYEGARSVGGAYLNLLAAPATAAGVLALGELLSYLTRLLGGAAAQRAPSGKAYWGLVLAGYLTNLSIPLLALAAGWPAALALFFVERLGKGLRAPARDVILAEVSEGMGRGKGFGLHELMDQVGAVAGPAVVGASIALQGAEPLQGYRWAFTLLAIPAALSIAFLGLAYRSYPAPKAVKAPRKERGRLGKTFWVYLAGSAAAVFGLLYWGLFSYHALSSASQGVISAAEVPLLYLAAMGVDAAVALPVGLVYDRVGVRLVAAAPLTALPVAPLLFYLGGRLGLYLSAAFWGAAMGVMETVMRAAVADIVPTGSRPMAYGVYSSVFGASWFVGGLLMSYLYQFGGLWAITVLSVGAEVAAASIYTLLPKSP